MNIRTYVCGAYAQENHSLVTRDRIRSVLKRDAPEGELEEARRPLRRLQYLFIFSSAYSFLSPCVLHSN